MLVYVGIFAVSGLIALLKLWKSQGHMAWPILAFATITLFVGYRYEIGVDWITYEIMFLDVARLNFLDALGYGDSAYSLVNWLASRAGGQVWHANLICAAIFSAGLVRFCDLLPRPGLALTVAIPTLVIITAMGYTRQAAAVGCIMLAFVDYRGSINWRWLAWLTLGLLFHKSAILMFPIFILSGSHRRWLTIASGGIIVAALVITIVANRLSDILSLYFEGDLESSGTLPRIAVGALAGGMYFLVRDKEGAFGVRRDLVRNLAIAMMLLIPLYYVIPSTVVDRIGVLLVPFQSAILSGLAYSERTNPVAEGIVTAAVISFYGATLVVWLVFATFASYWIPYENVLFLKWI